MNEILKTKHHSVDVCVIGGGIGGKVPLPAPGIADRHRAGVFKQGLAHHGPQLREVSGAQHRKAGDL